MAVWQLCLSYVMFLRMDKGFNQQFEEYNTA